MPEWNDVKCIPSTDKNVEKWVFSNEGPSAAVVEAVLYKYPTYEERTVICCSTQSGCPVGCRFCGAGDYFVRSLTTDEIVSQPVHLLESHSIDAGAVDRMQIMFMSMGEPLLNLKALIPAMRELYMRYPRAALLISTSAPRIPEPAWRALLDASSEIPTIGLQFSVHESTDEARDALIPFAKKLTLAEIADAGVGWADEVNSITGPQRMPFFNYCAHEGNSGDADADRLAALFNPGVWQATISVVCEREESVAAANERQRELATSFEDKMKARGYSTRTFDPAGQDDIGGGCGQLWFVQDWMQRHPERARPSVGNGLPMVHTPRPEVASV